MFETLSRPGGQATPRIHEPIVNDMHAPQCVAWGHNPFHAVSAKGAGWSGLRMGTDSRVFGSFDMTCPA